jgi:hypothetical protein
MTPADPRTFPAPGSAAPGAPPPLRRALTPADGIPDAGGRGTAVTKPSVAVQDPAHAPRVSGVGVSAAAAMIGLAAGLEIAGLLSRRRER